MTLSKYIFYDTNKKIKKTVYFIPSKEYAKLIGMSHEINVTFNEKKSQRKIVKS